MKDVQYYTPGPYMQRSEPVDEKKFNEEFREARELHDRGVAGDDAAVKKACDLLKKLHWQDPMNYRVEAYLGSATALLGRDDMMNPMDRMKIAKKGLKMLDRAVSMARDDIGIRSIRGHVCFNLPEMYFMRTKYAIDDFSYIVSAYENDKKCVERNYYLQLLYNLGVAYMRLGRQADAEASWKKLVSLTKDRKYLDLVEKAGYKATTP